jgi:hypothetical protein
LPQLIPAARTGMAMAESAGAVPVAAGENACRVNASVTLEIKRRFSMQRSASILNDRTSRLARQDHFGAVSVFPALHDNVIPKRISADMAQAERLSLVNRA